MLSNNKKNKLVSRRAKAEQKKREHEVPSDIICCVQLRILRR